MRRIGLDPVRHFRPPPADRSLGARLGVLVAVGLLLFAILGFRLWFLQILSGESYEVLAMNNRVREVEIEAARGVIYDRDGEPLVENRAGLSVAILPMDLKNEAVVVRRLADVLSIPEEDIWSKLDQRENDPYRGIVIKEDVPEVPVVTYLKEHSLEFPGVTIRKSYLRNYLRGQFGTHILGHVGEISPEELEREEFRTLHAGQRVGKNGVEPTPGRNRVLTIDADLQASVEQAIEEGLDRADAEGFKEASAAAVVALNPRNGEVLALASYPDYDPSVWVGSMSHDDYNLLTAEDAHKPLFNRAIMGRYPAGSTFKPFVAAVSLK